MEQTNMRAEKLGTAPVWRTLLGVSVPIALGNLVQASYNIIDGIFVSGLSEEALTATSLSFSVQMLIVALISGMCTGMNAVFSKKMGQGRQKEANDILLTVLLLCFFWSALFWLFGAFGMEAFFRTFTDDEAIVSYGVEYLSVCTKFYLPSALTMLLERVLQATNHSIFSFFSHGAGMLCNMILDPILIFGVGNFAGMGIKGAAVATVFGQTVSLAVALFGNLKCNRNLDLSPGAYRFDFSFVKSIYAVGLPVTVMQTIGTVMTYSVNRILIAHSSTAVAFFGIYYKLQMFIFMPIFAFGQGLISLAAYNFGAGHMDRVKAFRKNTMLLCVAVASLGFLAFQLFPEELLSLFHPTAEMLRFGCRSLRIISLIFPIEAVCVSLSFSFQGIGRGDLSLYHSVIRQLGLRVPLCYLFTNLLGVDYAWYSFVAAEIVALFLTVAMSRYVDRKYLDVYQQGE